MELRFNNHRAWFQANKHRYDALVRQPFLRFIADFAPRLRCISPDYVANPRSLFRIHRDTRYSANKAPYKTHAAAQFRHQLGQDVHMPGFYIHLEPDNCFLGAGMWMPEPENLRRIRAAIARQTRVGYSYASNSNWMGRVNLSAHPGGIAQTIP